MRNWIIRIGVLAAFALVLWLFGPRAYVVLAARLGSGVTNATVDLDQVAAGAAPAWLRDNPALYRSLLEELSPFLDRRVGVHDTAALEKLTAELDALSWVKDVRLRRSDVGGFNLSLELHRPVLEVVPIGDAAAKVARVYATADGICLQRSKYDLNSGLPICRLLSGPTPGSLPVHVLGAPHPDRRVLAAAAVAVEWSDQLAPAMAADHPDLQLPPLVEVDATNLDYDYLEDSQLSEVRIALRRTGGGVALFDYGHPPSTPFRRVALADRVRILANVLRAHPGLRSVVRADLRFANMWKSWVRTESDANAPVAAKR